jgi:Tol biopolymer transport system component
MSPDGSRALISGAVENESNTGVWLLDVASGERLMLTSEGGVQEESSASLWSPDGKYTLLLGGENGVPHTWVFPLDGGLPFNLGAGTPLGWAR